jgi:L-asparaginase
MNEETSILIIYTGGTIGMIKDQESGALIPFNFDNIYDVIPDLKQFNCNLDFYTFDPLIDSSNMNPVFWSDIAKLIGENYEAHDGFVILHGSDTMAFTASALSFMLENLNKPVILTGSQLPLGFLRTDGRDNLIAAIEIAAATEDETPLIPEVCIYFENQLIRGNRAVKYNAENFNAFASANYPPMADAGIYIKYKKSNINKPNFKKLKVHTNLDPNVGLIKLFPGITKKYFKTMVNCEGMKAMVIETFGSGNATSERWFTEILKEAINSGLIVLNVSQCLAGSVDQGKYETSVELEKIGVIGGADITTEAAITKLMYLLGRGMTNEKIIELLKKSLRGEHSSNN